RRALRSGLIVAVSAIWVLRRGKHRERVLDLLSVRPSALGSEFGLRVLASMTHCAMEEAVGSDLAQYVLG
ncbi:hypothetical protein, partial [Ferrimicrobium acidiphilum]|uniref:hypothetical protein n=1 Tax=Ferrimicrobium acidiphilum TaxID=121039 RepID=UPI0023F24DB6